MEMLPIGSVVKIDNNILLIIGFYPIVDNEIFEYLATPYPLGLSIENQFLSFNHRQVQEVLYEGYSDKTFQEFKDLVLPAINKIINTDFKDLNLGE